MANQRGVWLPDEIMALTGLSQAEQLVLAQVCYRASRQQGICQDTNAELASALHLHRMTVSSTLQVLVGCELLEPIYGPNSRGFRPLACLLALYERPDQE